ncbi:MAG: SRPBCC domain-containing protein, partial [Brevefilum sp.]
MPEETPFVFEKKVKAPAELIYKAFTSATSMREWLCDVGTTCPEKGGRIYMAWYRGYFASGHFIELIPNEKVVFSWIGKEEPDWTRVEVSISPHDSDDAQMVTLHHLGIGEDENWEKAREEIHKGWEMGMENLKSTLEEGLDLRVMDRPLIGIYPEDIASLTENSREKLGIPVDYGVLVTNVVPDYGAEKAGIRADDVIVAIGGEKVDQVRALGVIINQHTVGDQIQVEVFRGEDKLTFEVDTKAQKAEALPESPEELAKVFETRVTNALEALENSLEGVTDAEASYSPGPEEWSAKETLVHLIHNERDMHGWINDLVSGQERFYDEWPGDRLFRIRATLTT